MLIKLIYCILFTNCVVLSRHVPRFADLDEEDQHLLRAAYETPSYDHDDYQEQDDMIPGKLDLLKDGLWAVKTKIKELKAFNKALVANLLSTKLKVKELVANSIPLKKHQHADVDKKKPSYYAYNNYQAPPQHYAQPQYGQGQHGQSQYGQGQYEQGQYGAAPVHQPEPQYGQAQPIEAQYATQQHPHDPYYGL